MPRMTSFLFMMGSGSLRLSTLPRSLRTEFVAIALRTQCCDSFSEAESAGTRLMRCHFVSRGKARQHRYSGIQRALENVEGRLQLFLLPLRLLRISYQMNSTGKIWKRNALDRYIPRVMVRASIFVRTESMISVVGCLFSPGKFPPPSYSRSRQTILLGNIVTAYLTLGRLKHLASVSACCEI